MQPDDPRRHYWERWTAGGGRWRNDEPPGDELAALRGGVGREAGSVPSMWPYYTTLNADGRVSAALNAEHVALSLFAVHQQSKRLPVHRRETGLGSALYMLRSSEKFSQEAIDRRFAAAATATSFAEISAHLRGLITQLRTVSDLGLDYSKLFRDLVAWQNPARVSMVRRQWGSQYFTAVGRRDGSGRDQTIETEETA
jgi:CRISPR system Cascade subunit CasB